MVSVGKNARWKRPLRPRRRRAPGSFPPGPQLRWRRQRRVTWRAGPPPARSLSVAARAGGWSRRRWSGSPARVRAAASAPAGGCGPASCFTAPTPSPTSSPRSSWAACASAACAGTGGREGGWEAGRQAGRTPHPPLPPSPPGQRRPFRWGGAVPA